MGRTARVYDSYNMYTSGGHACTLKLLEVAC